jgi:hypothetical protein
MDEPANFLLRMEWFFFYEEIGGEDLATAGFL